jgi:hypothetical protein
MSRHMQLPAAYPWSSIPAAMVQHASNKVKHMMHTPVPMQPPLSCMCSLTSSDQRHMHSGWHHLTLPECS